MAMAEVVFYGKPGCINNTRQKRLLQSAGHKVIARNLLYAPWTSTRLLAFFEGLPVAEWFNRSAPQITSGMLDPQALTQKAAIHRMLADPLLIRRPLMEVAGKKIVGFDAGQIDKLIGLNGKGSAEDLETCPRQET